MAMKTPGTAAILILLLIAPSLFRAQSVCAPAKHAKLPNILDMTYHKGRTRLLKAGWQPYVTIHHNEAESNPNTAFGNGREFWEKGYWEVNRCAGTGLAPCSFLFEDAYSNRLRVTTAGEELPKEKAYATVTGFRFVCD